MNTQPTGRELAAEGASVAADHADDENGFWTIYAEEYFRRYVKEKPNCTFMTEQVREYAERDGFEPPPDKRCLLYTSPSPRDRTRSRMPSSA